MYLTDLVKTYSGENNPQITDVTQDSRAVKAGSLFVAIRGTAHDGHDFVGAAIAQGAAAVIVDESYSDKPDAKNETVVISVPDTRIALSNAAAAFYKAQHAHIVAVTGTNGKTSVAHFVQQLWAAQGHKAVSIGTLGVHGGGIEKSGKLTTPDTVGLHAELSALADAGITHLAMEASSHGIEQHRLDGVCLKAAGFTNLSRDHLDYHGTMEAYLAAKAGLFTRILLDDGVAVINADTDEGQKLLRQAQARGLVTISYGFNGQAIQILDLTPVHDGQEITIKVAGQRHHLKLPLVGGFQVMNVLCALGLLMADNLNDAVYAEKLVLALGHLQGAPGRLQLITGHPHGAVYVDYAHTPDALENVLKALRVHTAGKLFCIVGCGGDRDAGKRPIMGGIANDLADIAVITDDNPRTEDAASIRAQMMAAAPKATEIGDRAVAIAWAVNEMKNGDVLVIAGKGHEQGQIVGDTVLPFDDAMQAQNAIELLQGKDRAKG